MFINYIQFKDGYIKSYPKEIKMPNKICIICGDKIPENEQNSKSLEPYCMDCIARWYELHENENGDGDEQ